MDLMVPFDGIWSLYIMSVRLKINFLFGILIDNVRLRNVPEPRGLLLLLIGATGIAWARRRKPLVPASEEPDQRSTARHSGRSTEGSSVNKPVATK